MRKKEVHIYTCYQSGFPHNRICQRVSEGGTNVVEIFVNDCVHAASSFAHSSAEDLPIKVPCYAYDHSLHRHPDFYRLPPGRREKSHVKSKNKKYHSEFRSDARAKDLRKEQPRIWAKPMHTIYSDIAKTSGSRLFFWSDKRRGGTLRE